VPGDDNRAGRRGRDAQPARGRERRLLRLCRGRTRHARLRGDRRLKILLVDDAVDLRDAARDLLAGRGHTVVTVANGDRALEAAAALAPDLALVDVGLARESGVEVARSLAERYPKLAIVLMSAGSLRPPDIVVDACGARGFITKDRLASSDLGAFTVSP
jgi:CheY-like chemotaxis protein